MPSSSPNPQGIHPDLPASRRFFRRVRSSVLQYDVLYQFCLKWKYGASSLDAPQQTEYPNKVLQNSAECQEAAREGRRRHEPLHRGEEKNWDHLAAVRAIAGTTPKSARVLDAGAEFYSNVLPALYAYGYRDLYGINLAFADRARRGSIRYLPGDITRAEFPDGYFDAVTCMSVIEHGVPVQAYFREMFRLLKPGGVLITSTDYYQEPIDTKGLVAYGSPIKIFSRQDVEEMIAYAIGIGFEATGPIALECSERPCQWEPYNLSYTFLIFTLRKPMTGKPAAD